MRVSTTVGTNGEGKRGFRAYPMVTSTFCVLKQ